jgi:predicted RNA-binding protein with PIN domain
VRLIVDGMNVIGARPDHWWRDRPGARRRLVSNVASRFETSADEVTIVFDGRPEPGEQEEAQEAGITTLFAPGGPNAADHAIEALLQSIEDPGDVTVVTSDAALAEAARGAGATVVGAGAFRRQLEES